MRRSRQGFTLIEVMIATAIAVIVLVGALAAGVQLQRRAVFEEQAMGAQESARAVKDLLTSSLMRAGAGFGSARLNVGATAGVSDDRYAITVTTDAPFGADGTFALPAAPYNALTSDALDVFWGNTSLMMPLEDCPSAGFNQTQGGELCAVADATAFAGLRLMVVNPATGVACYQVVTNINGAGNKRMRTDDGLANNPPPNTEPCDRSVGSTGFWDIAGAIAMQTSGASLRVNWKTGAPILELDQDGVDNPTLGWVPVSREVERIKVRLGVATLNAPAAPLVWFPDAVAGNPAIDACTNAACLALIPGGVSPKDLPAADPRRARDALMRRVRLVELLITTRSARRDNETALPSGATFVTDAEGILQDGYKRRTFSVGIAPRNLAVAGVKQ